MPTKSESDTNTTEDKPHEFLEYENVTVLFVFCGIWDTQRMAFSELVEFFNSKKEIKHKVSKVHERSLNLPWAALDRVYQPSFVGCDTVITIESEERDTVTLIAHETNGKELIRFPVEIGCCVRVLSSGGVVCTYDVSFDRHKSRTDERRLISPSEMFDRIHSALRLAHSTTRVGGGSIALSNLLFGQVRGMSPFLSANFDSKATASIGSLFTEFLANPHIYWKVGKSKKTSCAIWSERSSMHSSNSVTTCDADGFEWQSPFVITLAKVSKQSYESLTLPDEKIVKEVTSILCKQTLGNESSSCDFERLNLQYVRDKHLCDSECKILHNYCLDDRTFFAFSERGALLIAADFESIPAVFVTASFVNSLEIVRSRWLFGCELSAILNRHIDTINNPKVDCSAVRRAEILKDVQSMYSKFVHDPTDYLLDGGSVTEVARKAEKDFCVLDIEEDIRHKLRALETIKTERDIESYARTYSGDR